MKPIDSDTPLKKVLEMLRRNAPSTCFYNGVMLTNMDDETSYQKKLDDLKTGEYKCEII